MLDYFSDCSAIPTPQIICQKRHHSSNMHTELNGNFWISRTNGTKQIIVIQCPSPRWTLCMRFFHLLFNVSAKEYSFQKTISIWISINQWNAQAHGTRAIINTFNTLHHTCLVMRFIDGIMTLQLNIKWIFNSEIGIQTH